MEKVGSFFEGGAQGETTTQRFEKITENSAPCQKKMDQTSRSRNGEGNRNIDQSELYMSVEKGLCDVTERSLHSKQHTKAERQRCHNRGNREHGCATAGRRGWRPSLQEVRARLGEMKRKAPGLDDKNTAPERLAMTLASKELPLEFKAAFVAAAWVSVSLTGHRVRVHSAVFRLGGNFGVAQSLASFFLVWPATGVLGPAVCRHCMHEQERKQEQEHEQEQDQDQEQEEEE